jgi:predicted amidohydrolase YtcJ
MSLRTLLLTVGLTGAVAVGAAVAGQAPPPVAPADFVVRGGRIVTLDERQPEAQALASRNGAIVAIGSNADVARFIGPRTEVLDLGGQLAIPGFIEGHGHFTGIGEGKLNLELMQTKSWDEIVQIVADAVRRPSQASGLSVEAGHRRSGHQRPSPTSRGSRRILRSARSPPRIP